LNCLKRKNISHGQDVFHHGQDILQQQKQKTKVGKWKRKWKKWKKQNKKWIKRLHTNFFKWLLFVGRCGLLLWKIKVRMKLSNKEKETCVEWNLIVGTIVGWRFLTYNHWEKIERKNENKNKKKPTKTKKNKTKQKKKK
jgi:hypothetical protein